MEESTGFIVQNIRIGCEADKKAGLIRRYKKKGET